MRPHCRPLAATILGLALATTLSGCGGATDVGAATVSRVIDGQTLEVEQDGEPTTVVLLGLDSPTGDECLGAESTEALVGLLPAGTEVRVEPLDDAGSGEEVRAAVYADNILINAELARLGLGLGVAESAGPIAPQIVEAEEAAIADAA